MNKYKIVNYGEDCNRFDMELTDEELKLVIKLFEENNKCADNCGCPSLFIYKTSENLYLNRGNSELNKEK